MNKEGRLTENSTQLEERQDWMEERWVIDKAEEVMIRAAQRESLWREKEELRH